MPLKVIDRGRQFSGYFIVKAEKPTKLFGVYWEHAWSCGTYVNGQGVTKGITFFIFFDDDPDTFAEGKGRNSEKLDLCIAEMDFVKDDPVLGKLLKQEAVPAIERAKLSVDKIEIIDTKFPEGFKPNKKMVDRNLIQLMPEFLGRTFAKAKRDKPSIWQPTIDPVSGVAMPNIWKINLGATVDS